MRSPRRQAHHRLVVWCVGLSCLIAGFALGRVWPSRHLALVPAPPPPQAQVALVIDDCGYHATTMPVLRGIDRPLTLSVLPHLAYSRAMAELGIRQHFEVMLHLPMEPKERQVAPDGLERHTLTTRMPADEVRLRLADALESIPHVSGVNNHMGSKATTDAVLMHVVLQELKRRGLYFVDSLVTSSSVCEQVARSVGIRFGRRAVFLDNENRPEAIRAQLLALVTEAKRRGSAIGIGHDRLMTLTVIRDMIPTMEARGVRLVPVSKVVRQL